MEQFMLFINLYTGISVYVILVVSYLNHRKGIIEKFTKSGKISLIVSLVFIVAYMIFKIINYGNEGTAVLKYFVEGIQLTLAFYVTIFYLNCLGFLNGLVTTKVVNQSKKSNPL